MKYLSILYFLIMGFISLPVISGVDLVGKVERLQIKSNDHKLWIRMNNPSFDTYCAQGWYGFNIYIPTSDPMFPYYYGLLTSALAQQQDVYIANISRFDGNTACDLSLTGYGIVVRN